MPRLPVRYDWSQVVFELRERRRETQVEFAGTLGCSVSAVSKWERGETAPAAKHRRRMAEMGEHAGYPDSTWPETAECDGLESQGNRR